MKHDENESDGKYVSARLPESLHEELEKLKKKYGITKAAVLRRGIANEIDDFGEMRGEEE